MNQKQFITLILAAGGEGTRFGASLPKQFLPLNGKPLFRYSLDLFDAMDEISEIIAVADPQFHPLFAGTKKKILFAEPGRERWNSIYNGLQKSSPQSTLILTHDSARPFIDRAIVLAVIEAALRIGAAAPGTPAINTIKQCTPNRFVEKTLNRSALWEIQTPQALKPELFHKGLALIQEKSLSVTDDLSIAELLGICPEIIPSSPRNFKITTPFDWKVAQLCAIN